MAINSLGRCIQGIQRLTTCSMYLELDTGSDHMCMYLDLDTGSTRGLPLDLVTGVVSDVPGLGNRPKMLLFFDS